MHKVPNNILTLVTPEKVRAFLRGRGFSERVSRQEGWSIMSDTDRSFVIPNDPTLLDYSEAISGIFENFTSSDETFDEILYQVFEPNCEIMSHRLTDDESSWGTATLESVLRVVDGYHGVVRENAKYVARSILARNAVERGKAYSNSCRLGQTDYGSYILRFILPSGPPVTSILESPMTFGFQVSSLAEETFAFIASDQCTDVDAQQEKPPSLNRKVIEHIAKISPSIALGAECEVAIRHADIMRRHVTDAAPAIATRMDSLYFDRVEILRQQYTRQDSFQRESYKCYVTDLHKDSPVDQSQHDHEPGWNPPPKEHKITVELRAGTSRRKLRLLLLPFEYKEAVRWHDEEVPLLIDATIDKRTSNWSVSELHEFSPYGDTEPRLF